MRRLIAVVLLIAACSSSGPTTPAAPTPAGNWTGTSNGQTFNLILSESGGTVTGSGTLTGTTSGTIALTVNGSYAAPTVSLSLTNPAFNAINLTATVAAKSMTGTLQGSGFTGNAITLTKP